MKIYDSFGPNPRALRMFLLEKGVEAPKVDVDLLGMENRRPPYTDRNPGGQLPALELDDGRVIGETVAIFEYLEERFPTPPLVGSTAEERAEARSWQRRVELRITEHLYNGFRFAEGLELFRPRLRVRPEAADGLKATVQDNLAWLDPLMAGKQWIVGRDQQVRALVGPHRVRQVGHRDLLVLGERDRALDAVLQLAHVAGPAVGEKLLGRRGCDAAHPLASARRVHIDEVLGQEQDVSTAGAQGRHLDVDHVDAEVEVLAEAAVLHERAQVAVRGGDHAHVEGQLLVTAHRTQRALLEGAQQLGLEGERHVADLVEQHGAAVRLEQEPGP